MHREQHTLRLGVGHLFGDELFEGSHAHHGGIENFTFQKRLGCTQFRDGSIFSNKFNLESVGLRKRDGLFVAVEVVRGHAGNMGLHRFIPHAVAMRIVAGVVLHRLGCATVGVALAQHRVHGGTLHLVVLGADGLFFVVRRSIRIVGHIETVLLEFGDSGLELRHRRRNVRKLDDVCARVQRELAQEIQVVARLAECGQDTAGQGNVLGFNIDIGRLSKTADNRKQGLCCQKRRLVGKGIVNLGIHTSPKIENSGRSPACRVGLYSLIKFFLLA